MVIKTLKRFLPSSRTNTMFIIQLYNTVCGIPQIQAVARTLVGET